MVGEAHHLAAQQQSRPCLARQHRTTRPKRHAFLLSAALPYHGVEFGQVVLDGRARQQQAQLAGQAKDGLVDLGLAVLRGAGQAEGLLVRGDTRRAGTSN